MQELIWREPKVKEETGLSKSTRWRMMRRGEFPQKVQLGPRAVGWLAEEVVAWARKKREGSGEGISHGPIPQN